MANFSHLLFQAMKRRSIVVVGNDNKSNVNVCNNSNNNNNNNNNS